MERETSATARLIQRVRGFRYALVWEGIAGGAAAGLVTVPFRPLLSQGDLLRAWIGDLNADTPYNTRTHKGLPPTAIANPGTDALRAAVYPESTKYYYYALGDNGSHSFFATYREQQNFIATQELYKNEK